MSQALKTYSKGAPFYNVWIAQVMPSHTIMANMQHAVQRDRSPARIAQLAQILLKNFEQSRDSIRKALGGTT